jgi:hypothetical protein
MALMALVRAIQRQLRLIPNVTGPSNKPYSKIKTRPRPAAGTRSKIWLT